MALTKLHIAPKRWTESGLEDSALDGFDVPFNPTSYAIRKDVSWSAETAARVGAGGGTTRELDAPPLEFGGGGSRRLTLNLFFDVTEDAPDARARDVRVQTNKLVALSRIERDQARPPICELSWGSEPAAPPGAPVRADFPFLGVVTALNQSFVMFRSTGEPVRAKVEITFTEFILPEQNKRETDPDLTTHQLKGGDTLAAIAAHWYGDPARWRPIAIANGIDDPRGVLDARIGARLVIPKLR